MNSMQPEQLLKTIESNSVRWEMGSNAYGMATHESDVDYVTLFHDMGDSVKVFRSLPQVLEFKIPGEGDNPDTEHKVYSLTKFIDMLSRGNPNAIEMSWYEPELNNN